MRINILIACGLLAGCGGGTSQVLGTFEENVVPTGVGETTTSFEPVVEGETGYVTFGLLLNDVRAVAGVQQVTENAVLNTVAQDYAQVQVNGGFLSHIGEDGSTVGDRALSGGYDYSYISENIARGFDDDALVFDAWMGSETHRANILDGRAEEFGIGRENQTWVMLLGAEFD